MRQVAAPIWNRIAATQKLANPSFRRLMAMPQEEMDKALDEQADAMEADGIPNSVIVAYQEIAPLLAENEAISRYINETESLSLRNALPEILNATEATTIAAMDRMLSGSDQQILLDMLQRLEPASSLKEQSGELKPNGVSNTSGNPVYQKGLSSDDSHCNKPKIKKSKHRGLSGAMHIDDFKRVQRGDALRNMRTLLMSCRDKFLDAARLLELQGPVIENLREFGQKTVDLWPLMDMYAVICDRYTESFFSPQGVLFPNPADAQDEKWRRYFHRVLMSRLLDEDVFVRNVLRAMMAIPCKNPQLASDALVQHVSEMTLPDTRPLWAPEGGIHL